MGCAMFTMQLHIPLNSELGGQLSIIQHLIAVATVSAVKSIPGYEVSILKKNFYARQFVSLKKR